MLAEVGTISVIPVASRLDYGEAVKLFVRMTQNSERRLKSGILEQCARTLRRLQSVNSSPSRCPVAVARPATSRLLGLADDRSIQVNSALVA